MKLTEFNPLQFDNLVYDIIYKTNEKSVLNVVSMILKEYNLGVREIKNLLSDDMLKLIKQDAINKNIIEDDKCNKKYISISEFFK